MRSRRTPSSIREISIAFRDGAGFAASMHLHVPDVHVPEDAPLHRRRPRSGAARVRAHRSTPVEDGYVIDFARNGVAVGIEVTSPSTVTMAKVNRLLVGLGLKEVTRKVLRPLLAA